jgi:D-alanine-D-alanine ligase-like ATP-grasp enzyme
MKGSFAARLFKRLASRAGVVVNVEPYGYVGQIVFPDGVKRYFRTTNFDLNTLGASEISRDKDYANYFMKKLGYPIIPGKAFYSSEWARTLKSKRNPQAAYRYAKQIGFSVIVKPNSLSQGVGVVKAQNRKEFLRAVSAICKRDKVFLVQRVVTGQDYRIVVLDGRVISAYERLPLLVVGDGKASVAKLMNRKQRIFKKTGRDTIINQSDFRITGCLRRLGMNRSSVPAEGQVVELLDNRNLSSGGDPVDVTDFIHPDFRKIAIRLTKDMGLRFCGVDLMIEGGISNPAKKWWVIEINSAPGIDNYASAGKEQIRIVEDLYVEVLKAMHGSK